MAGESWDPTLLPRLVAGQHIYRLIDDDDINGWNESERRWDLAPSALDMKFLTPSQKSGFGLSVFVDEYLAAKCGATPGAEIVFLRTHLTSHACVPEWIPGIVVRLDVQTLLAHRMLVSESPGDSPCPVLTEAHASVWLAGATRAERNALLKVIGSSYVYEAPKREHERRTAGTAPGSRISKPPVP